MIFKTIIVDDESFVTEWVSHLMTEKYGDEVDILKCSNAETAMENIRSGVFDLAVLDINMPILSGVDIMKDIVRQKLDMQVIFLTAHSEFEYAKEAINNQAAAYVLKGESDNVLLQKIDDAMARIRRKAETSHLLEIARKRLEVAAPAIRAEYITRILTGMVPGQADQAPPIQLAINWLDPVIILISGINDAVPSGGDLTMVFQTACQIEEFLNRFFFYEWSMPDNNSFVWLIQPRTGGIRESYPMLLATIENIQTWFSRYTGKNLRFIYSGQPVEFHDIARAYEMLSPLQGFASGTGHVVLTEDDLADESHVPPSIQATYEPLSRLAPVLQRLLDQGEEEACMQVLEQLLKPFDSMNMGDTAASEAYHYAAGVALSYMNKTESYGMISQETSLNWLRNPGFLASWGEARAAFRNLYRRLFHLLKRKRTNRSEACVFKVQDYVRSHLDVDLSLIMLADLVHLNPSYFSSLFKLKTGLAVSEFIKQERLNKARQQLAETRLKINEIARNVGYPNAAYFGKFFKAETGLTPVEFRERSHV